MILAAGFGKRVLPLTSEKPKPLLKEAGYGKGFKMELIATNGRYPADKQTCEASAGYLNAVGIKATCNAQIFPLYKKSHRAYNKGKKKKNKYNGNAAFYMGYGNGGGNPGSIAAGTCLLYTSPSPRDS